MKKSNQEPLFSIITVCYNGADDLEKTILSVREQTSNNYEYLVVDGGSKDHTKEILNKYDKDITYWVSEADKGIYNAMNKGAHQAKGKYLYFLNAGDVFANKEVLNEVEKELKDNTDLIYGQIMVVNKFDDSSFVRDKTLTKLNLKFGIKVSQQAVFVKKVVFDEVSGLNEKYKIAADFDLLCKVFEGDYSIKKVDIVMCDYDRDGISSNLKKSYADTAKVIKDNYGSAFFVIYNIFSYLKLLVSTVLQ